MATDFPINPPLAGFDPTAEYGEDEAPFKFGTMVETIDADGDYRIWRFVKATAAKTAGLAYMVDETWLVGAGVTSTLSDALPQMLGVPAQTSSDDDADHTYNCFWIQTGGVFDKVTTDGAVADNAMAYTTATAGKFDDSGGNIILGGFRFTALTSGGADTTAFSEGEIYINQA